jgi:carboxynorspermidine decarboxylase
MGSDGPCTYRLGGNSCLSGDWIGDWSFPRPLQVGDPIVFDDMIHYTTVKTTMFNGIAHPAIGLWTCDGHAQILRSFSYEDYRDRMC